MKRWAVPVAALALPLCLVAESLPIRSYSTADGLAADRVDEILADSRGFVWFATSEGLSRFDGYRFVTFGVAEGLPHRSVNTILETKSGEYLVGTPLGLSEFQAGTGKFTTYLPGKGRRENYVNAVAQGASGRIWCATAGGLFEVLSGHRFRRQPLPPPPPGKERLIINDLLEDAGGNLLVGTRSGIYVVGKDDAVQHIAMGDLTENVRALLQDRGGRIWAGTQDGLVLMRNPNRGGGYGIERIYREAGDVRTLDITSLAEGPDGAVWAGASAGIARSLPGGGAPAFRMLTRAQGLIARQVNALTMDRAGNMWAATEGSGVMKIQPSGFTTFREQDGLEVDRVWSVLADRAGTVVAVTASERGRDAVNLFDGSKFHAMSLRGFSDRPPWGTRILLQARNREWWAATGAGLCRYAPAQAAALAKSNPLACYLREANIRAIFEDSKGFIWATADLNGTNRLLRWDPATQAAAFIGEGRNAQESVAAFAEDRDNNIWLALGAGDLLRYSSGQYTRFKAADGVLTGAVNSLLVDSGGRLWVASNLGLGLIEHPASPHLAMKVYRASDGLSSDTVYALAEDAAGRIYASTVRGLDRLDPRTGHIKHFSTADGLAHGSMTMSVRDGAGDLWFATTQGLSRLTPGADRAPSTPSVRITDLRIGRERYPVSQVGETHVSLGDLQPSQNQFQVAFVGFSDELEANLRYTYRLEGGESGWQGAGRDHEANYPGLEPGSYRFLVKAVNSEGQPSVTPAEIDFVILPPVWRRWWFEMLALAMAGGLAFTAYRRRLQGETARVRLLYEERLDERTRIARELHDTLLQNLAGVSLQLDGVAKQIGPSSAAAASRITAVRQQVDASFREARQKVLDLRSPMLQGRALPEVLQESVEQIAAGHPLRLRATVTGQPRPLREDVDETVLRIAQEAVANAVRHAHASEIQVSLTYGVRSLSLRVKDDGQGFNLDEASRLVGHWGLRNMQERAQRIGAEWKLASSAGHGTEIEIIVPLPAIKQQL